MSFCAKVSRGIASFLVVISASACSLVPQNLIPEQHYKGMTLGEFAKTLPSDDKNMPELTTPTYASYSRYTYNKTSDYNRYQNDKSRIMSFEKWCRANGGTPDIRNQEFNFALKDVKTIGQYFLYDYTYCSPDLGIYFSYRNRSANAARYLLFLNNENTKKFITTYTAKRKADELHEQQAMEAKEQRRQAIQLKNTKKLRANPKVGDRILYQLSPAMIVEVKPPIVLVQFDNGNKKWAKINEIFSDDSE